VERREAGFTLVEVLVALAIAVMLGALLLRTAVSALHWTQLQSQRVHEHAQMAELVDRFDSEENSAWAIFTPPNDVAGRANGDGHEVDFFTRDGRNDPYFWAYTYDANAQTLTRSTYSSLGGAVTPDVTYTGITNFYAHTYPVTALQDPSSKIYSPLYAGATLTPGSVSFLGGTNVAGGNQITYIRLEGPTLVREMQLSTQTAPSGFVVVLQYTPAPTATPQTTLNSWPPFVELPMQGQALQASWTPAQHDIAYYINRLLGGGVANATLAPCATDQARAFTDNNFTTPLANATAPAGSLPTGVSGYTDAGGCVTFNGGSFTNGMPNVALYEPGYTGTFGQNGNTCGPGVSVNATYPGNEVGPTMQLVSIGVSTIVNCAISWQDAQQRPASATTIYRVVGCDVSGGILGLGSSCKFTISVPTPKDECTYVRDEGGVVQSGYTGITTATMSPANLGTLVYNGNNTYTFTRTSAGTVVIDKSVQWADLSQNVRGSGCTKRLSYESIGSLTYQ
jgi:prepilin-type N-terminal cleavage/methylation domain-containing protein